MFDPYTVIGTSSPKLRAALFEVNKHFDDNIIFWDVKLGKEKFSGSDFAQSTLVYSRDIEFELRVRKRSRPGARYPSDREEGRTKTIQSFQSLDACFHVHEMFFRNLFELSPDAFALIDTEIDTEQIDRKNPIKDKECIISLGDNPLGMTPVHSNTDLYKFRESETCDCEIFWKEAEMFWESCTNPPF